MIGSGGGGKNDPIALISYRSFVPGLEFVWFYKDNMEALILQRQVALTLDLENYNNKENVEFKKQWQKQIDAIFGELGKRFFAKIIVYVGHKKRLDIIKILARHGISADKLIFVMCGCHMQLKTEALTQNGYGKCEIIKSECGGVITMQKILDNFLQSGKIE